MKFDRIYSKLLSIPDISTVINGNEGEVEIRIKPENKLKWAYFTEHVEEEIPLMGVISTDTRVRFLFPEDETVRDAAIETFRKLLDKKYYLIEKPPTEKITVICKITNLCNLDCQYCYDRPFRDKIGHNKKLTLEEIDKVLDMTTRHARAVDWIFHGGEPSLVGLDYYRKIFSDIIPKYPYAEFDFAMQTNGTLLNKEWFEFAKEVGLNIGSSYSAKSEEHRETKEDNESVKNNESIFDVIPKIKEAKEMDYHIGVIDVVTKENMPMMIERYEFYKKEGLSVSFNQVEETGEAENYDFIFRSGKDKRFYLDAATDYFAYWLNDKECIDDRYASMYAEMLLTGNCGTCNYGCECLTKWFGINSNADIYPCDRPLGEKYRMGNLHDFNSIVEIFDTPQYKNFIDERHEKKNNYCSNCIAKNYCSGGCPLVDIDKHDSAAIPNYYSCTMMKLNLTAMFRALMRTDIDKCNHLIRDFIVANSCVLPNEIPLLLKALNLEDKLSGYNFSSKTAKLNSKEFELFKIFNSPEHEERLEPCVWGLSDCEEPAKQKDAEKRLSEVIRLLEERYKEIVRQIHTNE